SQRRTIGSLEPAAIQEAQCASRPALENLSKWHHPSTVEELRRILGFVDGISDGKVKDFLRLAFSGILTLSTARRGREHGWFADNTPLPRGESEPPYVNAIGLFLGRLKKNLRLISKYYAEIARVGESAETALARFGVLGADIANVDSRAYGVDPGSVGGIVTSPPYL